MKRYISTPSSPNHIHHITFGQQTSEFTPKINFEKTEISHLHEDTGIQLSPIVELSNEDTKGSNDLSSERCHCITFDKDQLKCYVEDIITVMPEYQNFRQIPGPLPKLQGATMNLSIGEFISNFIDFISLVCSPV